MSNAVKIPVDPAAFSEFIEAAGLFECTQKLLRTFLTNWYREDIQGFVGDMRAGLDHVLGEYKFINEGVSLSKSFFYDPPLDYISVWVRIHDEDGCYVAEYTAFYDRDLKCFDEKLRR